MQSENLSYLKYLDEILYPKYIESGFGKILKGELDLHFFHYFLLKELPQDCIIDDNGFPRIVYERISKKDIYDLSEKSKISLNRFQNLLENDFKVFRSEKEIKIKSILLSLIKESKCILNFAQKNKRVRLMITNPILRYQIIKAIDENDGFYDYSFNKDIIDIDLQIFIDCLGIEDEISSSLDEFIDDGEKKEPFKEKIAKVGLDILKNVVEGVMISLIQGRM